jgi:hypothetical protein
MVEEIPVIHDPMVRTGFILLGTVGGTFYLLMTVLEYRIIENMRQDKETAIAKFFLKNTAPRAFKVLTVAGLALVLTMLLEISAIATERPVLATTARIMYLFSIAALLYFPYAIEKVTRKN